MGVFPIHSCLLVTSLPENQPLRYPCGCQYDIFIPAYFRYSLIRILIQLIKFFIVQPQIIQLLQYVQLVLKQFLRLWV